MATFFNQATLTFAGRVTNSNVTEGEIVSGVTLNKTVVSTDYGPGDGIVYAVTLVNADNVAKTGITLTDDLGAYTPTGAITELIPLTYVEGSVLYYQNGVLQTAPTVEVGDTLVIGGIDIPAGGNAIILYEVRENEYAPLSAGSAITNAISAGGEGICEALGDTAEIPTRDEPILSITKSISPDTVSCGEAIIYTFILQNTGNIPVVATDDVIVSDVFNPILEGITVTLNGEALTEGTGYTYDQVTGNFTTLPGALPIPAATFTRDPQTGIVTTTPGVTTLVVTGTI